MAVSLQSLTQAVAARLASGEGTVLKPGQVLEALVLGKSADGLTQLKVGDQVLQALLKDALPVGTLLKLTVTTGGSTPKLTIVSQTPPALPSAPSAASASGVPRSAPIPAGQAVVPAQAAPAAVARPAVSPAQILAQTAPPAIPTDARPATQTAPALPQASATPQAPGSAPPGPRAAAPAGAAQSLQPSTAQTSQPAPVTASAAPPVTVSQSAATPGPAASSAPANCPSGDVEPVGAAGSPGLELRRRQLRPRRFCKPLPLCHPPSQTSHRRQQRPPRFRLLLLQVVRFQHLAPFPHPRRAFRVPLLRPLLLRRHRQRRFNRPQPIKQRPPFRPHPRRLLPQRIYRRRQTLNQPRFPSHRAPC